MAQVSRPWRVTDWNGMSLVKEVEHSMVQFPGVAAFWVAKNDSLIIFDFWGGGYN